jgi:NitT/TauT family transport system ATP-binding protein
MTRQSLSSERRTEPDTASGAVPAPATEVPKLGIDGICRTFAAVGKQGSATVALENVSLDVQEGELVSIIGPSGCGKSTLLEIAGGLQEPTSGRILVDGTPTTGPGPERAIIFQSYALFPWRTVLRNVAFPLEVSKVSKAERESRAAEALRLVGLSKFRAHYPAQLSGGMRQRVAIARAFIRDPDILLMDEPFGALDAITRELLQEQLSTLHREQRKTVLFITHSVSEAVRLSDRVIVLGIQPGRVVGSFTLPRTAEPGDLAQRERDYSDVRDELWNLLLTHGNSATFQTSS